MSRLFFILCLAIAGTFAEQYRYDGYELLSVFARHEEDVKFLFELGNNYVDIDFWREPAVQQNATVLVPPGLLEIFKTKVTAQGMEFYVMSSDVQSIVEDGSARTPDKEAERKRQTTGNIVDHTNYHRYARIVEYLNQLAAAYPSLAQVSNLNYATHNGLRVRLIKLGSSGTNKPAIIVEAGIHAREWISPAANLWAIEKLLRDYTSGDATARSMLDKYDWFFVPSTNPDGYEYSHTTNRMWRKNRRYVSARCSGIDLNRNFDIVFGTTGISRQCDSDIYPGESAFSEPETANIRDLFNSVYARLVAYVSVHSYSQFILVPWGYTQFVSRPSNSAELDRVTLQMTSAISARHGRTYRHGTAWQLLNYAASGASEDWALNRKAGIYAMCFELRPSASDSRGFLLPANEIIATGEEYYDSLKVLADQMRV